MMIAEQEIWPGMITETYVKGRISDLVCWVLSRAGDPCYASHNGIVVRDRRGDLCIGDSLPPKSRLTPLRDWYRLLLLRDAYMRVLWPVGADERKGELAAAWWVANVYGRDYPELTACRLWVQKLINRLPYALRSRHEYKLWCTLGVREAWRLGARYDWSLDACGNVKSNPTPKTVQNRRVSGVLQDVSAKVLIGCTWPAGDIPAAP